MNKLISNIRIENLNYIFSISIIAHNKRINGYEKAKIDYSFAYIDKLENIYNLI